jgi:hypothetical protein
MRRLLILLAPVFLAACATHPPLDAECAANAMCAARAAEPAIIAATHGAVARHEDELVLKPQKAPALRLTDDMASCAQADIRNCVGYALMAAVPRAQAWVAQQFLYEGSSFLLIDGMTGRQTRLNGMPVFSPDGREFLVAPYDLESDVGPNDLEIWRRDGDGAVLEWSHAAAPFDLEEAAPPLITVADWRDGRVTLSFQSPSNPSSRWPGSLTRSADGWSLIVNAPRS